jgi:hypothetical protein
MSSAPLVTAHAREKSGERVRVFPTEQKDRIVGRIVGKDKRKSAIGVSKARGRSTHLAVLIVCVPIEIPVAVRERQYVSIVYVVEASLRRQRMYDFQPDGAFRKLKLLQVVPDVPDGLVGRNIDTDEDIQAFLPDNLVQRAIGLHKLVEYARNLASPLRSLLTDIRGAARREIVEQAYGAETRLRLRRLPFQLRVQSGG